MARNMKIDDRDFQAGMARLDKKVRAYQVRVLGDIGLELMRLSQFQVPHDTGLLQSSGFVQQKVSGEEVLVGYNKVYARRLHEHPEYRFQKGRKGKYLEDPMKHNLHVFKRFYEDGLKEVLT